MTLPRLIRKPQVDELGRLESMSTECWQGDPRGQAMSKRQRRQRLKTTLNGGERTKARRQETVYREVARRVVGA